MQYVNGVYYNDIEHDKYCYELCRDYTIDCGIVGYQIGAEYYSLDVEGILIIKRGYRWDGASGPAIDTDTWIRGSLVHDVLYQMLREEELHKKLRKSVDKIMYKIIRYDGMIWIRAQWSYYAVRWGGASSARKQTKGNK